MSEAPDPQAVEPVVEPLAEIPAPEPAEAAPTTAAPAEDGDAPAGEPAEAPAEPEEPKKPKSPVAQLQGRVGHLTKVAHEKDATIADQAKQLEAYKALLAGQRKPEGEAATPAPTTAAPADFKEAVAVEARRIAAEDRFTADCNSIFEAGEKAHGEEFKEAVTNLNLLGLMNGDLVEAALATDAPADVIHYLGTDPDEAARITALPPIRMAAELVKLSSKIAGQTKPAAEFSRAPAPIRPIGGTVKPEVDIASIAKTDNMAAYVEARKAQGSRWAR